MNGPYDGDWAYIVILVSKKRTLGRGLRAVAFEIVKAATGTDAIKTAFPEGSPILSVKAISHALAMRLGEPRDQVIGHLEVERPKWGQIERSGQ